VLLDDFLEKLEGVRPSGSGYVALCPGHEDRNTSLSVTEGEDQKIVLKCHAGCDNKDVVKKMGLEMKDLFARSATPIGEPEAIYQYRDSAGNPLYENCRMPGKRFRQRHLAPDSPDAKADGYVYNLDNVDRVPYMFPELIAGILAGKGVWIVEGEKDADSMVAQGCVATSSKNFRPEWCSYFIGANVTIIADRDEVGRSAANKVYEMLKPYAANVRVLQAKQGKDATDHFEAGFGVTEFVPIRKGPRRGIVTSLQLAEGAREALTKTELDRPGYALLENCPIVFRNGRMYSLGAYTSDGKTRLAMQLTRRLCSLYGIRMGYFSLEMPETDLRNILIAHKGVPLRILEEPWTLPQHPDLMQIYLDAIDEITDWHLDISFQTKINADYIVSTALDREHEFVIVDHIHRMGSGSDRSRFEQEIQKLTNLALENDIPVLLLCQLRKPQRGERGGGGQEYPKPALSEFRETSVIADDSAMALALWRVRDQSGRRFVGSTDLTILKNRYTTGRHDGAGTGFLPDFDISTQLFSLSAQAANPVLDMHADDDTQWQDEPDDEMNQWIGGLFD
jgi:hypothetical protein